MGLARRSTSKKPPTPRGERFDPIRSADDPHCGCFGSACADECARLTAEARELPQDESPAEKTSGHGNRLNN
jgi:hypothetical protein